MHALDTMKKKAAELMRKVGGRAGRTDDDGERTETADRGQPPPTDLPPDGTPQGGNVVTYPFDD